MNKRGVIIFVLILMGAGLFYFYFMENSNSPGESRRQVLLMDTLVDITVYADDKDKADALIDEVIEEMRYYETIFSRHIEGSEVSEINRMAGIKPVKVSPEVFEVIQEGIRYGELTGGAFDITIAPLLDLWGFGTDEVKVPTDEELAATLELVNYRDVQVNPDTREIFLPKAGMKIDLGGIAKGYLADRGIEILQRAGVQSAYLDAGGDIRVIGSKVDGSPWRIGIRHPRQRNDLAAVVPLRGKSIVTSGDYERFFEENGIRYHHILDPDSGYPAYGLASVTIVSEKAMDADALATSVFVLGPEDGIALLERLPDVEGVLISDKGELLVTTGLKDNIEILIE